MLPGEEPTLDPTPGTKFIVAAGATNAPGTVLLSEAAKAIRLEMAEATLPTDGDPGKKGLMSVADKEKLAGIPVAAEVVAAVREARREHAGVVIEAPGAGSVLVFRNLRGSGRIISVLSSVDEGTATAKILIDGENTPYIAKTIDADTDEVVSLADNNAVAHKSKVTLELSDVSDDCQNFTAVLLIEYDV